MSVAVFAYRASTVLFILGALILVFGRQGYKDGVFYKMIVWTLISIFISVIPAYLYYGQSLFESIRACTSLSFGLIYYFLLKQWKFPEENLLNIIKWICVIWVVLELGQQITYPRIWFSNTFSRLGEVPERMGLYRVYIWGIDFVMIAFSYYLGKMISNGRKKKDVLLFLLFFAGILCYCSRKHILTCLFAIAFSVLQTSGSKKIMYGIFVTAIFIFLYVNFYDTYHEMSTEVQAAQGEGGDFIRFISAKFFLFDYSAEPLYPLWGAGIPGGVGGLFLYTDYLGQDLGIYQADVGIIGYYSMVGLLGVSAIMMYIVKFIKNWRYIDNWFKYFFIMKMFLIVFDFWAIWGVGMFAYAVFLYMLELNIKKNKEFALS